MLTVHRQVALADMQVSAADGAGQDLDQQFAGSRRRHRLLHVPQRAGLDQSWLAHHPRLHRFRAANTHPLPLSRPPAGRRAQFYDATGAVLDMLVTHLFQVDVYRPVVDRNGRAARCWPDPTSERVGTGRPMAGTDEPVAVLGIGAMGHGMAASALRAGIPTIVWDRRTEATRDLAELGAQVAGSAADAARRAAIVVTMVTDADAVISIARDQGMLAALAPGAIWAQMSTIGVAGIGRVAALARAERSDVMLLDAPVSGSRDPAERGELTIFASGPGEARQRVAALFGALGQRTIWAGEAGAGTRLKLVNNTWLAFATEAVAASAALARQLGLETETVLDALSGSPLVSLWQAAKLQRIADGEFSAQFALSLALKDVHLALQAAGDSRFAALACLADEWQRAVDQGLGEQDLTVVTRAIGQQEGPP